MTPSVSPILYAGAAGVCLVCTLLVLVSGRGRVPLLLAGACGATVAWAALVAADPEAPVTGASGVAEVLRGGLWLALLLVLCRRVGGRRALPLARRFAGAAVLLVALSLVALLPAVETVSFAQLGSPLLLTRLALSLLVVLLAENLYRNADEGSRWHVVLPCIALGGLAAFDVVLYTDATISRALSPTLLDARAALAAGAMPMLTLAAMRERRWRREPRVSRQVVFHGATLMVAGAFLLGVGAFGEVLRRVGGDLGQAAQVSLLAGAVMALLVVAGSRSARSHLRRLFVDHFFAARYDYRREWMRCAAMLSAPDTEAPALLRALRAIADPLDSPAGVLLLRDAPGAPLRRAESWNRPDPAFELDEGHPLVPALRDGTWVAHLGEGGMPGLAEAFGPLWLAVPLAHHRDGLIGVVLLAPPRVAVAPDGETYDLLRTLGREVAMFIAERRAAEHVADQRKLEEYAKRFAFVAHDVKTVSSGLTMILANAEENMDDPDFQADMLVTVRASAERIATLIARLRQPEDVGSSGGPGAVVPLPRLRAMAEARHHPVLVEDRGVGEALAAIAPERFDAAVTHLLDNAVEASPPGVPVRVRLLSEGGRMVVEIEDRGPGMTAEFIRDRLFRPLDTSKPHGNGIGVWQARDLLRAAGGDLGVRSAPGEGTAMRLVLPFLETAGDGRAEIRAPAPARPALQEIRP